MNWLPSALIATLALTAACNQAAPEAPKTEAPKTEQAPKPEEIKKQIDPEDARKAKEPGALLDAIKNDDLTLATRLIEAGADVNQKDDADETALMKAVMPKGGRIPYPLAPLVPILLDSKADVHAKNKKGETALMIAADGAYGVPDPRPQCIRNCEIPPATPERIEAARENRKRQLEMVNHLLKAGARLDDRDQQGWTPLFFATKGGGDARIVEALIAAGADVNAKSTECAKTPLMLAADLAQQEALKALIKAQADVSAQDQCRERSPLMLAALNNDPESEKALIEAGARLDSIDEEGLTALMLAAQFGNINALKTLIDAKANLNAKDHFGQTALMLAVEENRLEAVKALIEAKADLNVKATKGKNKGKTALKLAQSKEIKAALKAAKAK